LKRVEETVSMKEFAEKLRIEISKGLPGTEVQ